MTGDSAEPTARKPFPWLTCLLIVIAWVDLNLVLIAFLEEPENKPRGRVRNWPPERIIRLFDEHRIPVKSGEGRLKRVYRYRLLKPAALEPGKRYPVVLFLHGAGNRGDDNRRQLFGLPALMAQTRWRSKYPCYLIAPQCPKDTWWSGRRRAARAAREADEPDDPLDIVLAILEEVLKSYPADPRRVYLTGVSMGGFGCWQLTARRPELFAAVVPVCGCGDVSQASRLIDVPIWAVHGNADRAVPARCSREMIEAITQAGGNPNDSELEGVGHGSWTWAYDDANEVIPWMFQQVNTRIGSRN